MADHQTNIEATLIPGDGIGPEIVNATLKVLDAVGAPFKWDIQTAGMAAVDDGGDPLPQATLDSIARTRLALKGPLATPTGGGYRSSNVRLREAFKLYANVRPAKTIVPGRYDNVDILLVRENLEGLYTGREHYIEVDGDPHAVGVAIGVNSKAGVKRSLRFAFEAAKTRRGKITIVHKANILKILSGVYLEAAMEVAEKYPEIEVETMIVDACAMNLVLRPERFDVIATTNLFGDILSDLIAGLVGGLGLVAGANIGENAALFEAVHGTAPDIAGRGIANPTALLMSASMMLGHVGHSQASNRLHEALIETLVSGKRTGDLGGKLNTDEFADAVIQNLA